MPAPAAAVGVVLCSRASALMDDPVSYEGLAGGGVRVGGCVSER